MQQRTASLVLGLLCGLFVLHALYLACVVEDAFITFRFARNLALGHGFVWNIGEAPIEGFTTFLWVLLSGASIAAGLDVFRVTQGVGLSASLGSLLLTYSIARRHLSLSRGAALVPCLFLSVSGPFAAWAASGMETSTFSLFVLLGVYAYLEFLKEPAQKWLIASAAALCVATLLRPEGGLVAVTLGALAATVFWSRTKATFAKHVVWGLTYSVPLLLFIAWRWNYFGDVVPNTFHQKTGGGIWQYFRGLGYLINFCFYFMLPLLPFPALLAWEAGLPDARKLTRLREWIRIANANEAITVSIGITLAYSAYLLSVGGDYMAMYRFMVPLLPFIYVLLAPMFAGIIATTAADRHKRVLLGTITTFAVLATFVNSTPVEGSFFRIAHWQHGNWRGVKVERYYVERFKAVGRFFRDYSKAPGESLATRSIGAVGYIVDNLAVHDLSGLTDRNISSQEAAATNQSWAGHEKWNLDYSFRRLPTYFMISERFTPDAIPDSAVASPLAMADTIEERFPSSRRYAKWIRENPEFIDENYGLSRVFVRDDVNDEEGWFIFLERKRDEHATESSDRNAG
jgi:arabinofuranosyltransferase